MMKAFQKQNDLSKAYFYLPSLLVFIKLFIAFMAIATSTILTEARAEWFGQIYLLGQEMRFERSQGQSLVDRKPYGYALGLWYNTWGFQYEASEFIEETSDGALTVKRIYNDQVFWLKKSVYRYYPSTSLMDIYLGAGVGSYTETIDLIFTNSQTTNRSDPRQLLSVSAGLQFFQFIWNKVGLALGAEARLFFSSQFDPNPMPGAQVKLGFTF